MAIRLDATRTARVCGIATLAILVAGLSWIVAPAQANRYRVQRGETLEYVAKLHGCDTDTVLRANHLDTTLVRPGTIVEVPACSLRARTQTRSRTQGKPVTDDAKARRALAVIDGAWVGQPDDDAEQESVGTPQQGRLVNGTALPRGEGYRIRRPQRAFGATHVVDYLRRAIADVRALYPEVHVLAIGDLSAQGGGKIADHLSHQSGLDVDVGFYFTQVPEGYPEHFVTANAELDLAATWALLATFSATATKDGGVEMIFLDEAIQERLHRWARKRGVPDDQLAYLLQYPRSRDTQAGLVRHWPNHADHMHVRFRKR